MDDFVCVDATIVCWTDRCANTLIMAIIDAIYAIKLNLTSNFT